jgi:2-polyprenyl-3-methyl-5-hydroxy-6-metoxy-1,4-benzoquinol methylase
MENRRDDANEHEQACARVAAHFPQRWLRGYVESKLWRDPIYPAAYELFRGSETPILDIGCGLGLLAFYLRERGCRQPLLGLDVDARKIRQGSAVAATAYRDVDLRQQDVTGSLPAFSGNIALLDLLHYLPLSEQTALLLHLTQCIAPGGLLVIRDCPRDNTPRFWMTYVAEKFAQAVSWNWSTSLHFPSREQILAAFNEAEFERGSRPLWGATPFNNQLFLFKRRASEVVPTGGSRSDSRAQPIRSGSTPGTLD